ncbi:MAG TPA: carboxypeptidase-like regulatory domain-containing protein [Flavobacteriales bacterium]|nr:carboxypeptidase-like regulatory domain-containing protein [Flavobacteriales bacterium]
MRLACGLLPLVIVLSAMPFVSRAQGGVVISGIIRDHDSHRPVDKASVLAVDTLNDTLRVMMHTDRTGRYKIELLYGHIYSIHFSAPAHVNKHVIADLTGASRRERTAGYTLELEMSLITPQKGVDYAALEHPVALCRFDKRGKTLAWDEDYAAVQRPRLDALLIEHEARRKLRHASSKP